MSTGAGVQAAFVATLVDEWVRGGVTDAVIAPGSRSTPVLDALAVDGRIRLHVVLDERSGGFVALGLGLVTGRPALMVTTSGTAAVEVHPAVVEAHQAGVPLLVVTADRPGELHHVGAPQTVEQVGLYGSSVRWAVSVGVADDVTASTWRSLAARTVADTMGLPGGPGPVHLNLELREPFLGPPVVGPEGRPGGGPWHLVPALTERAPAVTTVETLASAAGTPGVIVAGAGAPEAGLVLALAAALGWPVLADSRSGSRVPHPAVIGAADSLLRLPEVASWRPGTVLRLGRPWASKVLAGWLDGLGPASTQVLVDPTGMWVDPGRSATVVERADPGALCRAVLEAMAPIPAASSPASFPASGASQESGASQATPTPPASPWADRWVAAERTAQHAIDAHLAGLTGLSEAAIARHVVGALPDPSTLLTSSSMPVRDVEWWGAPRRGLTVLANRGANGIDGIVSTALGVALGAAGPTACLTGDLAFLYDAGALLGAAGRGVSLTFVVVDNDGGGIFSFLPQAAALPPERFERLWSTPHGLDLVAVARAYGVDAEAVVDLDALDAALATPWAGVRVLVARTDRVDNVAAHDRLNAAVATAVTSVLTPS
jgi:2-succinyl-5-enolpyruvyl-6-hydroxy-3-cyclohexene-1-carboxylate synthase